MRQLPKFSVPSLITASITVSIFVFDDVGPCGTPEGTPDQDDETPSKTNLLCNISNTRRSVRFIGYPYNEKRVKKRGRRPSF